ncbi:hypothetical protein GALMADRAFT_243561 [Galerina marginata CBS 339.88]|uniref:Autophagy-related protein 13 n=1 Tax=Galerina marginata (strain CBS 339.88) TaxID=685588 RepID=A0A067TKK7_GALM3|nr:hypothetical protein GALMADRAFT_243561 [Galerina marginata CBS 339.88]
MSNDIHKADQIAFHFYTKLFYTVNHARATEESNSTSRVDKWFNLETPDSDLFTREAREPYRNISLAGAPGPPPLEIQVLLSVPELTNNQVLVYMSPDSSRVRIEPTPRFILLETWSLAMQPGSNQHGDASTDVALPIIYKHGIVLFRSVFSLLRVLPAWKFYKRLKRKTGGVNRNGHLGITLRVRSSGDSETDRNILGFGARPSPTYRSPLGTSTHTFPTVAHLLGSFTLSTTYLTTPNFQLDELESLLSSRFISLDLEGFIPTLDKNRQRDSMSGSSSLPNSSGIRSVLSRSPPKAIGRATSTGVGGVDSITVAEKFILPSRVPSVGASTLGTTASTGTSALIPPPRPFPAMSPLSPASTSTIPSSNLGSVAAQPIPGSGLAINRLRKESLNSSSSSSVSTRDLPPPGPNLGMSSLSSSPVTGPLPIRRPNINPVHPFKTNTLSSASGSSPSLSIRQGPGAVGGSPGLPSSLSGTGGVPPSHSRQPSNASPIGNPARLPPSPISGFSAHPSPPPGTTVFSPSSLGDRRPGTSGSGASSDRDRRVSIQSLGMGSTGGDSDDGRVHIGMAMPPRKRYSSSFGHRYVGSVGSGTGIVVGSTSATAGSNESRTAGMAGDTSMPGSGNVSGRATPASLGGGGSGLEGKKESVSSFLGTATDDDDISIFVQDIDSRKPLSGRAKEREKREELEEQERMWQYAHQGQVHEHERSSDEPTVKGKERERAPRYDIGAQDRRPLSEVFADDAAYTTSPPPLHATPNYPHPSSDMDMTPAAIAERAAQFSTSPTRSPMLTSQNEVEERLKKMNETFLKSLEGISGGSTRRKDRRKDADRDPSVPSSSSAAPMDRERERERGREDSSSSSSSGNYPSRASRGVGLGFPSSRTSAAEREVYSPYPFNTPGLGLGLGRGRYASTSSSTLATSEAGASQGSEEVIGRMELYEERRRSGYQG